MKTGRSIYQRISMLDADPLIAALHDLKSSEQAALHQYALGLQPSAIRDGIIVSLLMVAGHRALTKRAAKQAKRTKRVI